MAEDKTPVKAKEEMPVKAVEKTPVKADAPKTEEKPKAKEEKTVKAKKKTEKKTGKKEATEKKEELEVKKERFVQRKVKPKRPQEIKEASGNIKGKKKVQFRGRFGCRSTRRKNKPKWMKWRMPRGKDIDKKQLYGKKPDSGYRNAKAVRGIHPSGYKEIIVRNEKELMALNKDREAAMVSSAVGLKKKNSIVKKANELGVRILN